MSILKSKTPSYKNDVEGIETFLRENLTKESVDIFVHDAETLAAEHNSVLKLNVGDKAPNFELPNATNKNVTLYDVLKNKRVVVVFYRGAWCPYCNLQLKHFQAVLHEFKKANTEVIAISSQIPDASLSMKEKDDLEFEVLSDIGNKTTKKFVSVFKNSDIDINEMKKMGIEFNSYYADDSNEIPVPATYLIEQDGTVSYAASKGGDYRDRLEVLEIIEMLNK